REALLLLGAGRRLRAGRSTARRSSAFASRGTLGGCTFRRSRLGSGLGGSSGFGGGTQLFLDAGRRGDCRDGEVAIRDDGLDAFRQLDPGDVQRVGDLEAGKVS